MKKPARMIILILRLLGLFAYASMRLKFLYPTTA